MRREYLSQLKGRRCDAYRVCMRVKLSEASKIPHCHLHSLYLFQRWVEVEVVRLVVVVVWWAARWCVGMCVGTGFCGCSAAWSSLVFARTFSSSGAWSPPRAIASSISAIDTIVCWHGNIAISPSRVAKTLILVRRGSWWGAGVEVGWRWRYGTGWFIKGKAEV